MITDLHASGACLQGLPPDSRVLCSQVEHCSDLWGLLRCQELSQQGAKFQCPGCMTEGVRQEARLNSLELFKPIGQVESFLLSHCLEEFRMSGET